jgi:CxxC motif-containing protein
VNKEAEDFKVTGNLCKRGITYGIHEVVNPLRKVTSTVRIKDALYPRLPVITDQEVSKEIILNVMDEINKVSIKAPIKYADIIIKDVLNTDVNVIASRSMERLTLL